MKFANFSLVEALVHVVVEGLFGLPAGPGAASVAYACRLIGLFAGYGWLD